VKTISRVLYVEDEPDIQAVARIALETVGGLTTKICSSGEEALAEMALFQPDLVLLDVMMPGMDGPGTLAAMRSRPELDQIPVVFITAKVQPTEVTHYKSLGALDVLAKPFDPMKLAAQVRSIWSNRDV
jgi:CheY-like chemotaxis protein